MTVTKPEPVDLNKLIAQPCYGEKVLLSGLVDGRVMVQSTFKDVEFLRRMLRIAMDGVEEMAKAQWAEDEKEAKQKRPRRIKRKPRQKRLPPPGEPPAGLG